MDEERTSWRGMADAVVDDHALQAAMQEQADNDASSVGEVIPAEPVLSSFLQDEILKLVGKLGLAGAETNILQGVACDLHRLLGLTAKAVRQGYRVLLDDFLPAEPGDTPPGEPPLPPQSNPQQNSSESDEQEGGVAF